MYSAINPTTAWEIAGSASHNNFPDIFQLAIAAFDNADSPEVGIQDKRLPLIYLQQLSLKYAIALVKAMNKHKDDEWHREEKKWRDISESFKLEDD